MAGPDEDDEVEPGEEHENELAPGEIQSEEDEKEATPGEEQGNEVIPEELELVQDLEDSQDTAPSNKRTRVTRPAVAQAGVGSATTQTQSATSASTVAQGAVGRAGAKTSTTQTSSPTKATNDEALSIGDILTQSKTMLPEANQWLDKVNAIAAVATGGKLSQADEATASDAADHYHKLDKLYRQTQAALANEQSITSTRTNQEKIDVGNAKKYEQDLFAARDALAAAINKKAPTMIAKKAPVDDGDVKLKHNDEQKGNYNPEKTPTQTSKNWLAGVFFGIIKALETLWKVGVIDRLINQPLAVITSNVVGYSYMASGAVTMGLGKIGHKLNFQDNWFDRQGLKTFNYGYELTSTHPTDLYSYTGYYGRRILNMPIDPAKTPEYTHAGMAVRDGVNWAYKAPTRFLNVFRDPKPVNDLIAVNEELRPKYDSGLWRIVRGLAPIAQSDDRLAPGQKIHRNMYREFFARNKLFDAKLADNYNARASETYDRTRGPENSPSMGIERRSRWTDFKSWLNRKMYGDKTTAVFTPRNQQNTPQTPTSTGSSATDPLSQANASETTDSTQSAVEVSAAERPAVEMSAPARPQEKLAVEMDAVNRDETPVAARQSTPGTPASGPNHITITTRTTPPAPSESAATTNEAKRASLASRFSKIASYASGQLGLRKSTEQAAKEGIIRAEGRNLLEGMFNQFKRTKHTVSVEYKNLRDEERPVGPSTPTTSPTTSAPSFTRSKL